MLHCLLHCGFGVVLLKSFMNALPVCSAVVFDSKELPAIGPQVLCLGNFFCMCHWKQQQQQQHGRWQGRVEGRLVRPDPHQFHSEPGWGYWERGRALLCEYTDSLTSHGYKPEANFYFCFCNQCLEPLLSLQHDWIDTPAGFMVRKTQQSVHSCEITPSYHNVIISVHSSVQLLPAADFLSVCELHFLVSSWKRKWIYTHAALGSNPHITSSCLRSQNTLSSYSCIKEHAKSHVWFMLLHEGVMVETLMEWYGPQKCQKHVRYVASLIGQLVFFCNGGADGTEEVEETLNNILVFSHHV